MNKTAYNQFLNLVERAKQPQNAGLDYSRQQDAFVRGILEDIKQDPSSYSLAEATKIISEILAKSPVKKGAGVASQYDKEIFEEKNAILRDRDAVKYRDVFNRAIDESTQKERGVFEMPNKPGVKFQKSESGYALVFQGGKAIDKDMFRGSEFAPKTMIQGTTMYKMSRCKGVDRVEIKPQSATKAITLDITSSKLFERVVVVDKDDNSRFILNFDEAESALDDKIKADLEIIENKEEIREDDDFSAWKPVGTQTTTSTEHAREHTPVGRHRSVPENAQPTQSRQPQEKEEQKPMPERRPDSWQQFSPSKQETWQRIEDSEQEDEEATRKFEDLSRFGFSMEEIDRIRRELEEAKQAEENRQMREYASYGRSRW